MSVTKKVDALNAPGKSIDEKLYMVLSAMDFTRNGYRVSELGEGISAIEQVIGGLVETALSHRQQELPCLRDYGWQYGFC